MNNWRFISFFTTLMGLYAGFHVYVALRGMDDFPAGSWPHEWFPLFVALLFLSYPLGRFLERYWLNVLSETLVTIGAFWMAAVIYLSIGLFVAQMAGLIFKDARPEADLLAFVATVIVMVWGNWNATHSKVTHLDIRIDKQLPSLPPEGLRIVSVSDLHMGTVFNRSRMAKLVDEINLLKADLVLFPGDMLDEDLKPVVKGGLGDYLGQIQSRYGLFSSTGNHEYIGGVEEGTRYLREHGITVLRDQATLVGDDLYLVGRDDAGAVRFGGAEGKPLHSILETVDKSKAIILLDHSPVRLAEAVKEKVDLSLSGHTHHGQFWPWNLITTRIYEISRGYQKRESTHLVVSSGYGTWGPPIRIGSRSEILLIRLSSSFI